MSFFSSNIRNIGGTACDSSLTTLGKIGGTMYPGS